MEAQLLSRRSDEELPSHQDNEPTSTAITVIASFIFIAVVACVALLLVGTLASMIFMALTPSRLPVFSVTVDGFSGLDDRVQRAFNLTVAVDNLGGTPEVCVDGEAVVLYGGVPLATVGVDELCVPRKGAADLAVVAASGGVGLPRALAELMAAEKLADGAAHVEVRVIPARHSWFLSCTAALELTTAPHPYPCKKSLMIDESDGVRPDGSGTPGSPFNLQEFSTMLTVSSTQTDSHCKC